eukprot:7024071-Prymnesium_polylepis.1
MPSVWTCVRLIDFITAGRGPSLSKATPRAEPSDRSDVRGPLKSGICWMRPTDFAGGAGAEGSGLDDFSDDLRTTPGLDTGGGGSGASAPLARVPTAGAAADPSAPSAFWADAPQPMAGSCEDSVATAGGSDKPSAGVGAEQPCTLRATLGLGLQWVTLVTRRFYGTFGVSNKAYLV